MTARGAANTFRPLMATQSTKPSKPARASQPTAPPRPTLSVSRANAIWLGAAAVSIAIGYLLLARGDMGIAPVLLVLGYCVLLPIGIIKK